MYHLNAILFVIICSYAVIYSYVEIISVVTVESASFLNAPTSNGNANSSNNDNSDTRSNEGSNQSVSISTLTEEQKSQGIGESSVDQSDNESDSAGCGCGFRRFFGSLGNCCRKKNSNKKSPNKNNVKNPYVDSDKDDTDNKDKKKPSKLKKLLGYFKSCVTCGNESDDSTVEGKQTDLNSDTDSVNSHNEETNERVTIVVPGATEGGNSYDLLLMNTYLESQYRTADLDLKKSESIIHDNDSIYKSLKAKYNELYNEEICSLDFIRNIILTSVQLLLAKLYSDTAMSKTESESAYCNGHCLNLLTKTCKLCRGIRRYKTSCNKLSKRVEDMVSKLVGLLLGCSNKYQLTQKSRIFYIYKGVVPFKCSERQYSLLKARIKYLILKLVLYITATSDFNSLKEICNSCIHSQCYACKSVSDCPSCPGVDDLSSCSSCQTIQSSISLLIIKRNTTIQKIKKLHRKLEACETYLARKGKGSSSQTKDNPTDYDLSYYIEQKVRHWSGILGINYEREQERYTSNKGKDVQKLGAFPEDIKKVIVTGGFRLSPPKQARTPTPEEKALAIKLFEQGICTWLLKKILEDEIKEASLKIDQLTSSHTNCETCTSDRCGKHCANIQEVRDGIRRRDELTHLLVTCNAMGHTTKANVEEKIKQLTNSGEISKQNISEMLSKLSNENTKATRL